MIELDKLKVVYEIVKNGSFTEAGKALNVSQSAVSRTILRLEQELNLKIFDRTTRRMKLTREGERLYHFACKIFHELSSVERFLYGEKETVRTILPIYTIPMFVHTGLAQALKYVDEKQDLLRYTVRTYLYPSLQNNEIAILPHKIEGEGIMHRLLGKVQLKLYASSRYIKKYGQPRRVEELDNHQLLICNAQTIFHKESAEWLLQLGGSQTIERIPFAILDSIEGLLKMVEKGLGIAGLPSALFRDNGCKLFEILPEYVGPIQDIYCSYHRELREMKWFSLLLDSLERAFNSQE